MKQHAVLLTDDAPADLQELVDYIAVYDAPAKADAVLNKLEALVASLSNFPERGAMTKEMRERLFRALKILRSLVGQRKLISAASQALLNRAIQG